MKKIIYLTAFLFTFFPAAAQEVPPSVETEGVPKISAKTVEGMLPYRNTRSASYAGRLPDGSMLIRTKFAQNMQVHKVDFPLGARKQLTFLQEPANYISVADDETVNGFLFAQDKGGNENYRLYYFDLKTGQTMPLTDENFRAQGFGWTNGGGYYYSYNKRNGRDFDVYYAPSLKEPAKMIFKGQGSWKVSDVSASADKFILIKYNSINDSEVHLLDIHAGKNEKILPKQGVFSYGFAYFSKDAASIYYSCDKEEYSHLYSYSLLSGESADLTPGIQWDVEDFAISPNGNYYLYSVNANGFSQAYLTDVKNAAVTEFKMPAKGFISNFRFTANEKNIDFSFSSPAMPSDVYSYAIESKETVRYTESELAGLNTADFVNPQAFTYKSFGGLSVPAIYFKPEGKGPFPVLIYIHGGPESQYRPYFNPVFQYWIKHLGIAVVAPNVRGSSGYGAQYLKMDNGFKRKDSVKDIGALLGWIAKNKELDKNRIAVYGGSYGGYMVLASLIDYAGKINAGADVVGISNFITFLNNTKEYRRDLRRAEYGDERDKEMYKFLLAISPSENAQKIKAPLFIIHGANDPRVPLSEAQQIAVKLKDNGLPLWFMTAKNEGHSISKKENADYQQYALTEFWKEYLLKKYIYKPIPAPDADFDKEVVSVKTFEEISSSTKHN